MLTLRASNQFYHHYQGSSSPGDPPILYSQICNALIMFMYMNEYPQGEVIVLAQNYSCAAEINDLRVRVTHYDLA